VHERYPKHGAAYCTWEVYGTIAGSTSLKQPAFKEYPLVD
jgi:hypothetical protein